MTKKLVYINNGWAQCRQSAWKKKKKRLRVRSSDRWIISFSVFTKHCLLAVFGAWISLEMLWHLCQTWKIGTFFFKFWVKWKLSSSIEHLEFEFFLLIISKTDQLPNHRFLIHKYSKFQYDRIGYSLTVSCLFSNSNSITQHELWKWMHTSENGMAAHAHQPIWPIIIMSLKYLFSTNIFICLFFMILDLALCAVQMTAN